jgi:hypothetical protein
MNASRSAVVILSIFVTTSRANGRCSSYPAIMSCKDFVRHALAATMLDYRHV